MTGILSNQLPGRANPPDADNPLGSFKDRTAPGANDGSYLTQTWSNDRDSILQALFIASGLTPNGVEDTGTASQLFDALVNNRWSSIGNYLPNTIVTASDGYQYKCISTNGRDTVVVDPTTVTDRLTWVRHPYESGENVNGQFEVWSDEKVVCRGVATAINGSVTVTLPYQLPNPSKVTVSIGDTAASSVSIESQGYTNVTSTTIQFFSTLTSGSDSFDYTVVGIL